MLKKYVVPMIHCIVLREEERIASQPGCNGSCTAAMIAADPERWHANVTS